jgi:hypothetical protein
VITPSALNVLIIGLSVVIFSFVWRMLAAYIASRNEAMGGAMAAAF